MSTMRVELSDGNWCEVKARMTHGMRLAVQQCLPATSSIGSDGSMKGANQGDMDKANDALVLAAVVSWSYGSVSAEVLLEIPEEDYLGILRRLDELYSSGPLARVPVSLLEKPSL